MTAIFTAPEGTDTLTVIGESMRPMLTTEMGASINIFDTEGDEGMGPPPHAHDWSETYVMLAGELDVSIDGGEPQRLMPGMAAHAPAGTLHSYRIAADGTRFLTILTEGSAPEFYRQMDAEVSMPPDLADVVRIGTSHGIRFGS